MNATLSKKLRFSDVVYAINSTPKAIRLWLQRGLVEIDTPKPKDGGWTEYSFFDIAILALVRSLVNFGVDVPTASAVANKIMGDHFYPQMHELRNLEGTSPLSLVILWLNQRLYLYREGDDWQMKLVALWESELGRRKLVAEINPDRAAQSHDADFDLRRPSGIAELRTEHEPAPVYISIDVGSVLSSAFERANESVNEGAVDGGAE